MTLTETFTNTTGQSVNDLHIRFNHTATSNPALPSPFTAGFGQGTNHLTWQGGTVANNSSVGPVTFTLAGGGTIKYTWWWTLNGHRVGRVHSVTIRKMKAYVGQSISIESAQPLYDFGLATFDMQATVEDTVTVTSNADWELFGSSAGFDQVDASGTPTGITLPPDRVTMSADGAAAVPLAETLTSLTTGAATDHFGIDSFFDVFFQPLFEDPVGDYEAELTYVALPQ